MVNMTSAADEKDAIREVMGGTYHDRFVKRGGVWQFARKALQHDIVGDMALKRQR